MPHTLSVDRLPDPFTRRIKPTDRPPTFFRRHFIEKKHWPPADCDWHQHVMTIGRIDAPDGIGTWWAIEFPVTAESAIYAFVRWTAEHTFLESRSRELRGVVRFVLANPSAWQDVDHFNGRNKKAPEGATPSEANILKSPSKGHYERNNTHA